MSRRSWVQSPVWLLFCTLTILNTIPEISFRLHSVPVDSAEHSGINSGMPRFRWNEQLPEWQYWQDPLPICIPPESPESGRNQWGITKTSLHAVLLWQTVISLRPVYHNFQRPHGMAQLDCRMSHKVMPRANCPSEIYSDAGFGLLWQI